jgi:chromate reductase, NAD(P)H dehydrogenase (quinone)
MPKIVAFAGSTRRDSFNKRLIAIAAEGARQAGAQVSLLDLSDFPMPLFDQDDEDRSGKPERALAFKKHLMDHDGFLIAAPEYNSSITGVLKNAIDWASRADDDDPPGGLVAFRGKVVTLMSASPGALGGLRGLVHVRAILGNLGCIVLPDQVAVPKANDAMADGKLVDEKQHASVMRLGQTLAETIAKLQA